MAIFQGKPGKLVPECHHSGLYCSKDDGGRSNKRSSKMCKVQVKSSASTVQHIPTFTFFTSSSYLATNSFKALKRLRFHRLAIPSSPRVLHPCLDH